MTGPRQWNTGDPPTDANLAYLESLARPWAGITAEQFMDKLRGVIGLQRVLPRRVREHFRLPNLFIGDAAWRWSAEQLRQETATLCSALEAGLAAVHADAAIAKGGSADLGDRPATRGEEVRAALDAYRQQPGSRELGRLRQAAAGTALQRHVDQLDGWLARRRPSSKDRPIEYEIAGVLGDISRRIDELHGEPAGHGFAEARRAERAKTRGADPEEDL